MNAYKYFLAKLSARNQKKKIYKGKYSNLETAGLILFKYFQLNHADEKLT